MDELKKQSSKDKTSIKDLETQVSRLEAEKLSDFEKYKLGKLTKFNFIERKESIDKELTSLSERIDEFSKQGDEVVNDNELTRELMEKYIDSVLCEGGIVQKIIWK